MATGIEHRDIDGVMNAYKHFGLANYAIVSGRDVRDSYEDGNNDQGAEQLQDWLTMIQSSNTGAVYTLRVYGNEQSNIDTKTPFKKSTTFMLNSGIPVKNENGVVVIDRQAGAQNAQNNTSINNRLTQLEQNNQNLMQQLNDEKLKLIEKTYEHQLSGLTAAQNAEPTGWAKVGDMIAEKPELIEKGLETLQNIFSMFFGPKKDFINRNPQQHIPQPVPQVNGTQQQNTMETEDPQQNTIPLTEEGALINPFLTPEQCGLKAKQQYDIMDAAIQQLSAEQLDNWQMICIEVLENRISPQTVTHLLIAVACCDNDKLNKVLNNLS